MPVIQDRLAGRWNILLRNLVNPPAASARAVEGYRSPRRFAHAGTIVIRASVLDCASPLALFLRPPIHIHLILVRHGNPIRLEPIYGFDHGSRGRAFKPCRRAPRILAGHRHQPMFHRILMDIVQPRQIRALMREPGFTEVEPDLSPGQFVEPVDPPCRPNVQHAQHVAQANRIISGGGRVGDEMIMI